MKEHPFSANVSDPDITISVGLRFKFLFTASAFHQEETIYAGMYFDIPKLSATFALLSDVNDKCNAVSGTDYSFNHLLNIKLSAEFEVGAIVSASGPIPGITRLPSTHTITDMTVATLPTDCLSFDSSKLYLVTPTVPTTESATATGSAKNSGASSNLTSLLAGQRLRWALGSLAFVLLVATLL